MQNLEQTMHYSKSDHRTNGTIRQGLEQNWYYTTFRNKKSNVKWPDSITENAFMLKIERNTGRVPSVQDVEGGMYRNFKHSSV